MKFEQSFYIVLYYFNLCYFCYCLICCRVTLLGNTTLLGEPELYVWINIFDLIP